MSAQPNLTDEECRVILDGLYALKAAAGALYLHIEDEARSSLLTDIARAEDRIQKAWAASKNSVRGNCDRDHTLLGSQPDHYKTDYCVNWKPAGGVS